MSDNLSEIWRCISIGSEFYFKGFVSFRKECFWTQRTIPLDLLDENASKKQLYREIGSGVGTKQIWLEIPRHPISEPKSPSRVNVIRRDNLLDPVRVGRAVLSSCHLPHFFGLEWPLLWLFESRMFWHSKFRRVNRFAFNFSSFSS